MHMAYHSGDEVKLVTESRQIIARAPEWMTSMYGETKIAAIEALKARDRLAFKGRVKNCDDAAMAERKAAGYRDPTRSTCPAGITRTPSKRGKSESMMSCSPVREKE